MTETIRNEGYVDLRPPECDVMAHNECPNLVLASTCEEPVWRCDVCGRVVVREAD